MKLVKREKSKDLEYRADSLVYKVYFSRKLFILDCAFFLTHSCTFFSGVWTLLPAVICWSILPCNPAPQHYDSSSSFVSTVNLL